MKFLTAIAAGFLAHQTDHIFAELERGGTPEGWSLMGRYGVSYLVATAVTGYIAEDTNSRRDVGLLMLASGVGVGLGVALGRLVDYLRK
jgi:hypothetical protein